MTLPTTRGSITESFDHVITLASQSLERDRQRLEHLKAVLKKSQETQSRLNREFLALTLEDIAHGVG